MRILWASNSPFAPSGYGQQSALVGTALAQAGHDVTFFANYWSPSEEQTYNGLAIRRGSQLFGLSKVADQVDVDLVIFLGDPWLYGSFEFEQLKELRIKTAVWYPADGDPLSTADLPILDTVDHLIAMSPHGAHLLEAAGFEGSTIPHCVNPRIFYPQDLPRPDNFVVGIVANNIGTRKLLPLQLEAIALAKLEIEDLILYLHTDVEGERSHLAIDLQPLIRYFNLEKITFGPEDLDMKPSELARNYNRLDALLNCTAGEGFGIPIVEAGFCGIPAVTTRNSAQQYTNLAPFQVNPVVREYVPELNIFHSWPSVEGIVGQLSNLHSTSKEVFSDLSEKYNEIYSVRKVVENGWIPFLKQVQHSRS